MFEEEEEVSNYHNKELVLQCVEYSKALYSGSIENQQDAADFFYKLVHHEESFIIGLEILKYFKQDLYSNFLALCIYNSILSTNWDSWDERDKTELKQVLFELLNSDPPEIIFKKTSEIIAKIAIIEFPESWEDFLISTLTAGNSYILIYYLEHLENINEVPYLRRQSIHDIFLEHFELIRKAIFDSPSISPNSIALYSMLAKWAPIDQLITEQSLELLTTSLLENESTRSNSIECLDIIFVQRRLDVCQIFPSIHYRLLTNIYIGAQNDVNIAALLANILTSHIEFFKQDSSRKETIERKVILPGIQFPDEFEEEEEEYHQVNLQGPVTETIEIEVRKYLIYETFKDCFLLLANPSWCLSQSSDLADEDECPTDDQSPIRNEEEDQNEGENPSYLREPELYWSTWSMFLDFASSLKCNIEENPILNAIPEIFEFMMSYITSTSSFSSVVSQNTRNCFSIIYQYRKDLIEGALSVTDINIQILYLTCCCIDKMDPEAADNYVNRFLAPPPDAFTFSHLIRCISFLLRFFPEKPEMLDFFCESMGFLSDFDNIDPNLRVAGISSLHYLATYTQGVFYYNDFQLLKLIVSILAPITPGLAYEMKIIQAFYSVAAAAIIPIIDIENCHAAIADVTKNMIEFLVQTYQTILEAPDELFNQFFACVKILKEFNTRCFRLFDVHGEFLIDMCIVIIQSNETNERNLSLIELCFELADSLLSGFHELNEFAKEKSQSIIEPALNGTSNQFGFALRFLTNLASSCNDSWGYFLDVNKSFLPELIENIQPDSQYILNYLLKTHFWILEPELPLDNMFKLIEAFPFACTKPGLLIIKEFCSNYMSHPVKESLAKQGQAIFAFLTKILLKSTYKNYFTYTIRAYMSFLEACFRVNFDESQIMKSFFDILIEIFPKPNISGFLIEEETLNEGEERKPKEILYQEQKEQFFVRFLEHCKQHYHHFDAMKIGLKNLYIAANYCLPITSYSFDVPEKDTEEPIVDLTESILEKDEEQIFEDLLNDSETNEFIEGFDPEAIEQRILEELKEFHI